MSGIATRTTPVDGVAVITVDLSPWQGFVSCAAVDALADALADARAHGDRVAVLTAATPGQWFQHAWLPDLIAVATGEETSGNPAGWFRALTEITHPDLVTIAAISGDTAGGGAELGWACDLRVAETGVWFGQPEVQIGLATGIGGTSRLARLIGRTATAELVLDGRPATAERVHQLGGLNRLVAEGDAHGEAVAWATHIAAQPSRSLRTLKQMLLDNDELPLTEALVNEQRLFGTTLVSDAGIEGMRRIQARFDAGESMRDVYGSPPPSLF